MTRSKADRAKRQGGSSVVVNLVALSLHGFLEQSSSGMGGAL